MCFIAPKHSISPELLSSVAVIRISWVTHGCAVPCCPLVKTCWDRIACTPISPSLALGSVVHHHWNVCESSGKVLHISSTETWPLGLRGKCRPRPLPFAPCFDKPSTWLSLQIPPVLAHSQLRIFLSLYGSQSQPRESSSAGSWSFSVKLMTQLCVAYNL